MAKLTGAKKKAFLERMARGRRKVARASKPNPKRKRPAAKKKKAAPKRKAAPKKKRAPKKAAAKKRSNPKSVRKSKKAIGRASRPMAAEWAKEKRAKARKKKAGRKAGPHKKANPKRRRRNSEMDDASALYETFHQKAPGRIVEFDQSVNYPGSFAELGKLKELRVHLDKANKDFPFTRFGDCVAAATADGANIYFIGGDQAIDLDALDIGSDKDTIELGPCTYIQYHTTKGFHDFAPTDYWHRFGEEDGVLPRLGYDQLNKTLFLIGGNYRVKREGIVN